MSAGRREQPRRGFWAEPVTGITLKKMMPGAASARRRFSRREQRNYGPETVYPNVGGRPAWYEPKAGAIEAATPSSLRS